MTSAFIDIADVRWASTLERLPHDFYQLPAYIDLSARFEGGTPLAFWAEEGQDRALIPLIKRPLPESLQQPASWCDAVSPYGYPALLISPGTAMERQMDFLRQFIDSAQQLGLISVFIRLHPLLEAPLEVLGRTGDLVAHGQTVYIDLTRPLDELQRETRENHRRGIKKLHRSGYRVVIDQWHYLDDFISAYQLTMQRVQAEQFYFFNKGYFRSLRQSLGEHLHLCAVLSPEGHFSAGGLFIRCGDIVQYHLGGTSPDYLREAPSKLMFDAMRSWAKDAGCRFLHLGGGLEAAEDSLYHFKAGFSKLTKSFYTYRLIVDEDRYRTCLGAWKKAHLSRSLPDTNYFPAYRTP